MTPERIANALKQLDLAQKASMLARHTSQWQSVKRLADQMSENGMAAANKRQPKNIMSDDDQMEIRVGDETHNHNTPQGNGLAKTAIAAILGAATAGGATYQLSKPPAVAPPAQTSSIEDSDTILFPLQ